MISIIIPAYNEERRIRKTLENYSDFFRNKKKKREIKNFEIIVVINNTTDNTEEIVKILCKKYKEIKYLNFKEGGKGFAIIEGFKDALKRKSGMIGFVDADMSTPPEAFYDLINSINGYDGAIADRWNKDSVIDIKQSPARRFVSRGYNLLVRTLFSFSYRDTQCGAKIFKRKIIEENIHKIRTVGWGFDIALLFCLKKESKARIISIPTKWEDKQEGTINLKKTPILMFFSAMRLRLIHSPFNFIVRFYRKLPERFRVHNT